jgi:hypothetical protein
LSDHKGKNIQQEYTAVLCDEPDCEFYGQIAVQGLCFSTESQLTDLSKLDAHERDSVESLARIRQEHYGDDPEGYIGWIEAHYLCSEINWAMTLDECIHLRAENAVLKKRLKDHEQE